MWMSYYLYIFIKTALSERVIEYMLNMTTNKDPICMMRRTWRLSMMVTNNKTINSRQYEHYGPSKSKMGISYSYVLINFVFPKPWYYLLLS